MTWNYREQKSCTRFIIGKFTLFSSLFSQQFINPGSHICVAITPTFYLNRPSISKKWSSECYQLGVMMQCFHTPWMEISLSVSFYWNSNLLWYICANFLSNPWATFLYYDKKTFTKRIFKWGFTESLPCLPLILNSNHM